MTTPTSPIPFQRAPAAGFEQPFEMLQACHERVDRMLRLLRRLRAHLQTVGCDEQAHQAAVDVMRYFDQAAPAHHEDEERHVFPALRAAGLHLETVDRLQREHAEMAELWLRTRELLLRASQGPWEPYTPDEDGVLEQVAALYEWHIAAENELVFPTAARQLDAAAQAAMGEEMARRRGVVPPR
jgi:hemerythrin-like domain-containing protein